MRMAWILESPGSMPQCDAAGWAIAAISRSTHVTTNRPGFLCPQSVLFREVDPRCRSIFDSALELTFAGTMLAH